MDQGETATLLDMSLDDITKLRKQQNQADASGKAAKRAPRAIARADPYIPSGKLCRNCMQSGHLQAQCPHPKACLVCGKPDHTKANCPKAKESCRVCGQEGHLASRCMSGAETATGHCFVCGNTGHKAAECSHAGKKCDLCHEMGHLKAMCKKAQMPAGARAAMVAVVGRPILPTPATGPSMMAVPKACFVCGSVAHTRAACPHKDQTTCEHCGKQHFSVLCPSRKH